MRKETDPTERYLRAHPKLLLLIAALTILLSTPFWYSFLDARSISREGAAGAAVTVSDVTAFPKGPVRIEDGDGTRYFVERACVSKLAPGALEKIRPGATLTLLLRGADILEIEADGALLLRFEDARSALRSLGEGHAWIALFLDAAGIYFLTLGIVWMRRL